LAPIAIAALTVSEKDEILASEPGEGEESPLPPPPPPPLLLLLLAK
jgi:hypothetical protein